MLHINHPSPTQRREAVIVGVTRMADKICIGAIDTHSLEALRLLPPTGGRGWDPFSAHPALGQRIAFTGRLAPEWPPHTEGFRVFEWEAMPPDRAKDLPDMGEPLPLAWLQRLPIQREGLHLWMGVRTATTAGGSLYLPAQGPMPSSSVCFWRTPSPLRLKLNRYGAMRLHLPSGTSIKYVGACEIDDDVAIPAGAILRLSLSGSFQPEGEEAGHFVQLSGWWAPPIDGPLSLEA